MAEYIEREAVLYVLDEAVKTWRPYIGISKAEYLRIRYENIPAADVRPVVRGRWEYNPGDNIQYCSECMMPQDSECNYCPNCGADMREKADG